MNKQKFKVFMYENRWFIRLMCVILILYVSALTWMPIYVLHPITPVPLLAQEGAKEYRLNDVRILIVAGEIKVDKPLVFLDHWEYLGGYYHQGFNFDRVIAAARNDEYQMNDQQQTQLACLGQLCVMLKPK